MGLQSVKPLVTDVDIHVCVIMMFVMMMMTAPPSVVMTNDRRMRMIDMNSIAAARVDTNFVRSRKISAG